MSPSGAPVTATVTDSGTGQPVVTAGKTTSLTVTLLNQSGADIALGAGSTAQAATFGVYLPIPDLFSLTRLEQMQVTTAGWSGSVDQDAEALNIVCTQAGTWSQGASLVLGIGNVESDGPPATGSVTIAPSNMTGNVPLSIPAPLAVANPPTPGNLSLDEVLQVSLDSQGIVYRSDTTDPLTNAVFLNLKNIGTTPLATGGDSLPGSPQVVVSFVYGNTSGALAPDDAGRGEPPPGSAWNIHVGMGPAQTAWTAANPSPTSEGRDPQWVLKPSSTNTTILGPAGSDQANVTFSFSDIVSFTPAGHTQMLVLCTGFAKDATTRYDDHLFVLDIVKQDPPATRGLLSFFGTDPLVHVSDPNASVTIPLRWAMFDVASVRLITSSAAIAPLDKRYPDPKPLAYDQAALTLPPLHTSEAIFTTLQAFDGSGAYLNSLQFTVYAEVSYVVDPGGRVYPIALIGDTFWMLGNYDFAAPTGSYFYQDDPSYERTFGRLYDWQAAQAHIPDGWALPDVADWQALVEHYGGGTDAFRALVPGGSSGFNAQLGGQRTIQPNPPPLYSDMYSYGYYWTSDDLAYAQFSGVKSQVTCGLKMDDPATALSVRYVRHV